MRWVYFTLTLAFLVSCTDTSTTSDPRSDRESCGPDKTDGSQIQGPLRVEIVQPENGTNVHGQVTIRVTTTDDTNVVAVDFWLGQSLANPVSSEYQRVWDEEGRFGYLGTDREPPFEMVWDTTKPTPAGDRLPPGNYYISVVALGRAPDYHYHAYRILVTLEP